MPALRRRATGRGPRNWRRRAAAKKGRAVRRKAMYQSQVFTETFKANATSSGITSDGQIQVPMPAQSIGGKLMVKITDVPQVQQYSALYNFYKILKVQAIVIPKWSNADPNVAGQNNATGPGTIPAQELPRFTYAINDDLNDVSVPATELTVLQDNGARIKRMTNPFKINFRPKAITGKTDPITNQLVPTQPKNRDWLGFGADADHPADAPLHQGVDFFVTAPSTIGSGFLAVADVQYKVTFCCKDPR